MAELSPTVKMVAFTEDEIALVRQLYRQMQQIKGKTKQATFMVGLPEEQREVMIRWVCAGITGRVSRSI